MTERIASVAAREYVQRKQLGDGYTEDEVRTLIIQAYMAGFKRATLQTEVRYNTRVNDVEFLNWLIDRKRLR